MTSKELAAIKATLADLRKQMPLGSNDSETALHIAGTLVYELEGRLGAQPIQNEELRAIKGRAEAATPGPWSVKPGGSQLYAELGDDARVVVNYDFVFCMEDDGGDIDEGLPRVNAADNVAFIAHARTDVPALVAEVERLRGIELVWRESVGPFLEWAQSFLNAGRWGGHDVFDAVRTETVETAEEVEVLRRALHGAADVMPAEKFRSTCLAAGLSDADTKAIFVGQGMK